MTRASAVFACLTVLGTGACANTFDATRLGVPVTVSSPAEAPPEGTHFKITKRAVYLFWGAATVSHPSARKEMSAELVGAKSIADLKIKVRSRWSDVLITVLTLGLVVPRAVTYEGVVVGGERGPAPR